MADDISRWSDALARDPSSLVFLQLAEALRKQGQLDTALKIALRGLERHPHDADAHDLLARISVDRGDLQRAFDEWDMALRISPTHVGAMKGLGFVCFQLGRMEEAERYLQQAAAQGDDGVHGALATVRRSGAFTPPAVASVGDAAGTRSSAGTPREHDRDREPVPLPPMYLFADLLSDDGQAAMLLDDEGLVLAGAYPTADGRDLAQEVGAELSGISDEARRATRHLDIGDWRSIIFETDDAVVAMMPAAARRDEGGSREALVLLAASRATPLGLLRRLLERCTHRADTWLAGEAGRRA